LTLSAATIALQSDEESSVADPEIPLIADRTHGMQHRRRGVAIE
jgi:hypothetical protein